MPVMDNSFYHGRKLEDLTTEIQDKGIFLSVLAPRRLSALFRLYEKAGGDLAAAKEKNYAKDPRHLVLLSGLALQERPVTPKQLPPASVSPISSLASLAPDTAAQQQQFPPQRPGPGQAQQMPLQQQQRVINPPGGGGQNQPILNTLLNKQAQPGQPQPGQTNPNLKDLLQKPPQSIQQPMPPTAINTIINRPPGTQGMPQQQQQQQQQAPAAPLQQPPHPGPGGQVMTSGPGMVRPPQAGARERDFIWRGELEWQEKVKDSDQKITHNVQCSVSTSRNDSGMPEVRSDNWPGKLIMQLIPKSLVQTIGGSYFRNSKSVLFHPQECESLVALTNVMATGRHASDV